MKDRDPEAKPASTALRGSLSRRRALKTIGGAGLVASAAPFIVRRAFADSAQPMGPGGIPLARPEHPVTLPMYEDPLKAGMAPETGGDFVVYVYADYIDKGLVNEFCKAHGVNMQLTTYDSQDEAITKQATHAVRPDVVNITPDRLAQGVAGKLIKPINHSYIPNLAANVWDGLQSPFYDVGSQYTVPYTVYKTGIGWRTDKVSEDIAKLDNPWSIFWNAKKYTGYVGVLDDARESLVMAMLYRQFYDINTEDPAEIDKALTDLKALIPICNPKINITEYQTLATKQSWLHQSWSGDLLGAYVNYLPAGDDGSSLRFWSAPKGKGPIQNDCWAVSSTHHQAGAGPYVPELHPRSGCGLQQLRQIHRLSAAAEIDDGGCADRQEDRAGDSADRGHGARGCRGRKPAGMHADLRGPEALAERLREVQFGNLRGKRQRSGQ